MTRTEHDDDRLLEPAEGWLKGWPAPLRSSLEWEEAASATMARLRETGLGSTPDDLLAAPLPAIEGERTFELELPGDEPSLADIARRVVESGAALPKDLAREGLLAAERSRAARPLEPVSRSGAPSRRAGAAGLGHPGASAKPHAPHPVESRPLSAIHVASARSEVPHSEAPRLESIHTTRSSSRQTLAGIYLGGAALAVAAAALVIVLVRQPELASPSSLASAEHDLRPVAASPAPVAAAPRTRNGDPAPEPRRLEELPIESSAGAGESSAANAAPRATRKAAPSSANAAPTETLPFHVQPSPKSKVVLSSREAEAPPVAAEQQQAQAADLSAPAPAQAAPSGPVKEEILPERPSIGAVQAAVGSVMMGARSCLAGQDTGSRAQVTFVGPDGRVRSVAVSGPAAGTPAESCLRSALSAARVAPFSEPTFTASLTVRPP